MASRESAMRLHFRFDGLPRPLELARYATVILALPGPLAPEATYPMIGWGGRWMNCRRLV